MERYIAAHPETSLRFETILSDDYLEYVRESFTPGFRPSYCVADFNRDKVKDFAVILNRKGEPSWSGASRTVSEFDPDYPLRLVVFNGSKKGFDVAFEKDLLAPNAAFIAFDKVLYFGVFESDADTFALKPSAKTYKVSYPAQP